LAFVKKKLSIYLQKPKSQVKNKNDINEEKCLKKLCGRFCEWACKKVDPFGTSHYKKG
jgi:hypothetical protein